MITIADLNNSNLARLLYSLYAIEGSWYYRASPGDGTSYRYVREPIQESDLLEHLRGETVIGLPSAFDRLAKWIDIDVDTPEEANLKRITSVLGQLEIPYYASLSGQKGYHVDIFLDEPSPAAQVVEVVRRLEKILTTLGVGHCELRPRTEGSGQSRGAANVKLPLGIHPSSGERCYFLTENLEPNRFPWTTLRSVDTISIDALEEVLSEFEVLDISTGEIVTADTLDDEFSLCPRRPCVDVLWREGLQAPATRHSATLVIALAVLWNRGIPESLKEESVVQWVKRVYEPGVEVGYINPQTTLEYAVSEARRIYRMEKERPFFGVTCENYLLEPAMTSACRDEVACRLNQNRNNVDMSLLIRLGIFADSRSRRPGINPSSIPVYLALQDMRNEYAGLLFDYQGMPAFAAPNSALAERACISPKTARKNQKALCIIGLAVRVPDDEVPDEFIRQPPEGSRYTLQAGFYCLPDLTEELIRQVILPKARSLYGRGEVSNP